MRTIPPRKITKKKDVPIVSALRTYRCGKCGKETDDPEEFYHSKYSRVWETDDNMVPLCKQCITEVFDDLARQYNDNKTALMLMCHYLDVPYVEAVYDSVVEKNTYFSLGMYLRQVINQRQYVNKSFATTLLSHELDKTEREKAEEREVKWTKEEINNKRKVIEIFGSDPFEGYPEKDRRFLFNEFIKFLGSDDDTSEDNYKMSQIVQIVNNNNQIREYDLRISALDPVKDGEAIKTLNSLKSSLVSSNDKIAKENEISVRNRSSKDIGKNTLSGLMKRLREMGFEEAEQNYYDQLRSAGTMWAIEMSQKAIADNGMFDENDKQEIFATQRQKIIEMTHKIDDLTEENRLLKIRVKELE